MLCGVAYLLRVSLLLGLLAQISLAQAQAVAIDEAQVSGVKGYPIGIFGSGFGAAQGAGTVTILGAQARITKWTDTVIEAVVPDVKPGRGELVVINVAGKSATGPFEVYTIAPKFLARPADLVNLADKKKFVITGRHNDWGGNPADFLGYCVNHGADLMAPFAAAVDLGAPVAGDVWFSLYGSSDYYVGGEIPTAYTIDASADSKDGLDGKWTTLTTIDDNKHKSRIHEVTLTGQRWIRLNVTAMNPDPKVGHFRLSEIRVYRRQAPGGDPVDSIGIMGDSITYADLRDTGPEALYALIARGKNNGSVPALFIMGLVGASNSGLSRGAKPDDFYALANAIRLHPFIRFFGIAFGTNDSNNPAFLPTFEKNLCDGVEQLIEAGMVPILARLPDTDNTRHGYGTPETKKQAVRATDEVAARYHLIPGPDFYTTFRQDLQGLVSDGTHHTASGGAAARRLWADTFLRSGIYSASGKPE